MVEQLSGNKVEGAGAVEDRETVRDSAELAAEDAMIQEELRQEKAGLTALANEEADIRLEIQPTIQEARNLAYQEGDTIVPGEGSAESEESEFWQTMKENAQTVPDAFNREAVSADAETIAIPSNQERLKEAFGDTETVDALLEERATVNELLDEMIEVTPSMVEDLENLPGNVKEYLRAKAESGLEVLADDFEKIKKATPEMAADVTNAAITAANKVNSATFKAGKMTKDTLAPPAKLAYIFGVPAMKEFSTRIFSDLKSVVGDVWGGVKELFAAIPGLEGIDKDTKKKEEKKKDTKKTSSGSYSGSSSSSSVSAKKKTPEAVVMPVENQGEEGTEVLTNNETLDNLLEDNETVDELLRDENVEVLNNSETLDDLVRDTGTVDQLLSEPSAEELNQEAETILENAYENLDLRTNDPSLDQKALLGRNEELKNDPQYMALLEEESLKFLMTADKEWFDKSFSPSLTPEGYLFDTEGNPTSFMPSQAINAGLDRVMNQAQKRFDAGDSALSGYVEAAEAMLSRREEAQADAETVTMKKAA